MWIRRVEPGQAGRIRSSGPPRKPDVRALETCVGEGRLAPTGLAAAYLGELDDDDDRSRPAAPWSGACCAARRTGCGAICLWTTKAALRLLSGCAGCGNAASRMVSTSATARWNSASRACRARSTATASCTSRSALRCLRGLAEAIVRTVAGAEVDLRADRRLRNAERGPSRRPRSWSRSPRSAGASGRPTASWPRSATTTSATWWRRSAGSACPC